MTTVRPPVFRRTVYRGTNLEGALGNGPLAGTPVTGTTYTDSGVPNGTYTYVVRSVKLVGTGAGSFHNLSQSASVSVSVP